MKPSIGEMLQRGKSLTLETLQCRRSKMRLNPAHSVVYEVFAVEAAQNLDSFGDAHLTEGLVYLVCRDYAPCGPSSERMSDAAHILDDPSCSFSGFGQCAGMQEGNMENSPYLQMHAHARFFLGLYLIIITLFGSCPTTWRCIAAHLVHADLLFL